MTNHGKRKKRNVKYDVDLFDVCVPVSVTDPLTGRIIEITPRHADSVLDSVLNEPFIPKQTKDEYLRVKSKFEVIIRRMVEAAVKGDPGHIDRVLDRRLGRPKQISETKVATLDMNVFLEQLSEEGIGDERT
jgi:hypothetical protein